MVGAAPALKPVTRLGRMQELARRPWRLAAASLLGALFLVNVYRAATQSITHDEAVTWQWFLNGPFSLVFGSQEGDHHPLHTLLCKITVSLFGMSELSLRVPSLLGGMLYFYAVFRISIFLFGESLLFLLSVAFLTANPFVLDYLSCARGYSAALGFFLLAIYALMQYLTNTPENRGLARPDRILNQAGVAAGLSIASNVIMIFPTGALIATFLGMLLMDGIVGRPLLEQNSGPEERRKKKKTAARKSRAEAQAPLRSLWQALKHFVIPTIAVGGLFALMPRRLVYLEEGYLGPRSLAAILEGLVRPSFLHSPGHPGLAAWLPADLLIRLVTDVVPTGLAGLVILGVRIGYTWVRKKNFDALPAIDRFLLLLAGLLPLDLLMILISRYVFEVPYPEQRTVLYWIPLLGLAAVGFLKRLEVGSRVERILAVTLAVGLVLCVVQFVTQFNTRYYAEWAYCAATKDAMSMIRAEHAQTPRRRVRLGVTWQLEPGVNFYKAMWSLNWIEPVYRESADGDFDYYVLLASDHGLVAQRGLKVLLDDKLSGTVLARR